MVEQSAVCTTCPSAGYAIIILDFRFASNRIVKQDWTGNSDGKNYQGNFVRYLVAVYFVSCEWFASNCEINKSSCHFDRCPFYSLISEEKCCIFWIKDSELKVFLRIRQRKVSFTIIDCWKAVEFCYDTVSTVNSIIKINHKSFKWTTKCSNCSLCHYVWCKHFIHEWFDFVWWKKY